MNIWTVLVTIVNLGTLAYAAYQPSSSWLAADKKKSFWLTLLAFGALFLYLGLAADIAFAVGVLPGLLRGGQGSSALDPRVKPNPFVKQR